jgi:hypothetical protein
MAADPIDLVRCVRDYAEPRAILPNGRTGDHHSALHSLYRPRRGCDFFLRSCESRRANRDRHGHHGQLSHSCHTPRVSLFSATGKGKQAVS